MSLLSELKEINSSQNIEEAKNENRKFIQVENEHIIHKKELSFRICYYMGIILAIEKENNDSVYKMLEEYYDIPDTITDTLIGYSRLPIKQILEDISNELINEVEKYCLILDLHLINYFYKYCIDISFLDKLIGILDISLEKSKELEQFINHVTDKNKILVSNELSIFDYLDRDILEYYLQYTDIKFFNNMIEYEHDLGSKKVFIRHIFNDDLKIVTSQILNSTRHIDIYWETEYDSRGRKIREKVKSKHYTKFNEEISYKYKSDAIDLEKSECYGLYESILDDVIKVLKKGL